VLVAALAGTVPGAAAAPLEAAMGAWAEHAAHIQHRRTPFTVHLLLRTPKPSYAWTAAPRDSSGVKSRPRKVCGPRTALRVTSMQRRLSWCKRVRHQLRHSFESTGAVSGDMFVGMSCELCGHMDDYEYGEHGLT
jgi:hypothetical protein